MDPQALYAQLGRLIESTPNFASTRQLSPEFHRWLGQAHALVLETGAEADAAAMAVAIPDLTHQLGVPRARAQQIILGAVYRALAAAELKAPAAAQGAFIPAGNAFDAHAAFTKIFGAATKEVLLIDPYMDDKALTEFAVLAPDTVTIRLLTDERTHKPALLPALVKWREQYKSSRPIEARLAPASALHDRLIIVDQDAVWILTQSTNAFATRAPASIVRVDPETGALKVVAYEDVWKSSKNP